MNSAEVQRLLQPMPGLARADRSRSPTRLADSPRFKTKGKDKGKGKGKSVWSPAVPKELLNLGGCREHPERIRDLLRLQLNLGRCNRQVQRQRCDIGAYTCVQSKGATRIMLPLCAAKRKSD